MGYDYVGALEKKNKLGSARVVRTRQSSAGENKTVGAIVRDHSRSVLHNMKPSSHTEKENKKQIQLAKEG